MRRSSATLALVALLLFAGCSTIPGLGPGDSGENGSAGPPGVVDGSLENETALLTAHRKALVADGFAHDISTEATGISTENGSQRTVRVNRTQSTRVAANGRYRYRLTLGTGAELTAWANDTVEVRRIRAEGQTQYQTRRARRPGALTATGLLEQYLTSNFTVTSSEERGGRTNYTLTSTAPSERALPANATDVRNYEARAVVDGTGRVYLLDVSADYAIGGEDANLSIRYELNRTGVERVRRPGWVDQAG